MPKIFQIFPYPSSLLHAEWSVFGGTVGNKLTQIMSLIMNKPMMIKYMFTLLLFLINCHVELYFIGRYFNLFFFFNFEKIPQFWNSMIISCYCLSATDFELLVLFKYYFLILILLWNCSKCWYIFTLWKYILWL